MTEPSETSLRQELDAGFDSLESGAPDAVADTPAPPPLVPDLPPLEAPSMWGPKYKESFGKLAADPSLRPVAESWQEHWKEQQGYITKRDQEYADYRKRLDPVYDRIAPYVSHWQQQGMDPAQGIGQIMSYAEALAENPQATLMQLAELYGVDLGQLVAEQPYVDPQYSALEQRLRQFEQAQTNWEQQQQQARLDQYAQQVTAFAESKDEQGNPKYPHYDRLFPAMLGLANAKLATDFDTAYQMAYKLDSELSSADAAQRELSDAATRAAQAKKAVDASKTVMGKSTVEGAPPQQSLRDELAAGLAAAGFS